METNYDRLVKTIPTHWLRRELQRRAEPVEYTTIVAPGLSVMPGARVAVWRGQYVALSTRETDMLALLTASHPLPVTSTAAADRLWPDGVAGPECARFYVCALRRKMPGLILNDAQNGGYYLDLDLPGTLAERAS